MPTPATTRRRTSSSSGTTTGKYQARSLAVFEANELRGMEDMEWSSDTVRDLFVDPDAGSKNPTEDDSSESPPSNDSDSSSSSTPTAAIAGGVVGGVVGLAVIGGVIFLLLRRRRRSEAAELSATPHPPFSSMDQPLPGKYHDRSSPMSGMATSSGGVSELPSTQENSRYELEGENLRTELSGDYSQGNGGTSQGQHPTSFGSPHRANRGYEDGTF